MPTPRSLTTRSALPGPQGLFQFWKSWHPTYRNLFLVLAALTAGFLCWFTVGVVRSPAPVIEPIALQELEPLDIPVRHFQIGILPVDLTTESYLIFERTLGGALSPNPVSSYLFLGALLIGLTLMITVMTTLSRYWFFGGMGLLILILATLKLDSFSVFGFTNNVPFAVIGGVYGLLGYYFIFYRPTTSFIQRFAFMALVTASWVACLVFFGRVAQPLYLLSSHSILGGILLTVVFIFMVAHEIIASFVYIVSSQAKPTHSLRHFLVITAIYLVNLILLYADKKHFIQWNFFPGSIYLIFLLSAVLGYWGFRNREPQYESIFRVNPFGMFLYSALALIAFATMGYVSVTANDPPVELLKDAILYAHLGYGIIFFAYIISNFFPLLGENLPVYKVLYKPTTMPYFTFRLAGLIATFAFFAYANWKVSVNQMYAGQYNAIGDVHLANDTLPLAENYYRRSIYFATRNYHAHYAIAQILSHRNEENAVKEEYSDLAFGRPLDLAYLNWSQMYEEDNSINESNRILKEGLKDFPNNGLLQNALSLISAKRNRPDSALLLADAARRSGMASDQAETNFAGLSAKYHSALPADSLGRQMNSDAPGVKNNLMALASLQDRKLSSTLEVSKDTVLTIYQAALYNNYLVDQFGSADTSFLSKVTTLARRPVNIYFRDYLLPTVALACYEQDMKAKAFFLLRGQTYQGRVAKDYGMLGVWAIEQHAPAYAIRFLAEASNLNWRPANYYVAMALTEAGDLANALIAWEKLEKSDFANERALAKRMNVLLTTSIGEAQTLSDEDKYGYSRLRFGIDDSFGWNNFIDRIADPNWKARAILDRCNKLDEMDETTAAQAAFANVKTLKLTDKTVYDEIMRMDLRFLADQKQWSALSQALAKPPATLRPNERLYFEALSEEQAGQSAEAKKKFVYLSTVDPFQEDVVLNSIRYLSQQGQEKLKSYAALVQAMDTNPDSPKLIKEHIVQSWGLGFEDAVKNSADHLKSLIPAKAFESFLLAHPQMFQVTPH